MNETSTGHYKTIISHTDKRLKIRLFFYFLLAIVLFGLVIYHLYWDYQNQGGLIIPLSALIIGCGLGVLVTRMYKISWDHGAQKVISRLDAGGLVILVIYIVFDIFRSRLVGYFVHGPLLASTSFALLTGIIIGRVLGIRGKIVQELEENL